VRTQSKARSRDPDQSAQLLLQESPINRPRQPHQRMIEVDDLIEPRPKQILLTSLPPIKVSPSPCQITSLQT
jgi:hypothetical protein